MILVQCIGMVYKNWKKSQNFGALYMYTIIIIVGRNLRIMDIHCAFENNYDVKSKLHNNNIQLMCVGGIVWSVSLQKIMCKEIMHNKV